MSAPEDPLTHPKAFDDHPPNYQPPFQQQPQAFPGSDPKGVAPYVAQIPGVPPGLEYLLQINQILVHPKYFTAQFGKTYEIQNSMGQQIYLAKLEPQCCGPLYDVMLKDNSDAEVIHLLEKCKCSCSREVEIHAPPGTLIGYATLSWYAHVTSLSISDASKELVLMVVGPSFRTNIFGGANFEVKSKDETQTVGQISRDNEQFVIQIPLDLDVKIKAVLLGATLYLDYLVEAKRRELERRHRNNH
ncbi:phospholipid scramblase 3-like [Rhinatrema bivittatum]|uniref:phospholipid scramblase 3-like n=1 Tax=Rhinatrema bivittatum TaxID=194408 RepID=UPI00112992E0|nr:phospholipid scramblase 3-like [Rhinatrema bivittatum]